MNPKFGIIFFTLFGLSSAFWPCSEHTVGSCNDTTLGNVVVDPFPSLSAADCQAICTNLYYSCQSFTYEKYTKLCTLYDGNMGEYIDTCLDGSGPYNPNPIDRCDPDNWSPDIDPACYYYREKDCTFTGKLEQTVTDVANAEDCQRSCEGGTITYCTRWVYISAVKACYWFQNLESTCSFMIGPSSPSYEVCDIYY